MTVTNAGFRLIVWAFFLSFGVMAIVTTAIGKPRAVVAWLPGLCVSSYAIGRLEGEEKR